MASKIPSPLDEINPTVLLTLLIFLVTIKLLFAVLVIDSKEKSTIF